MSRIMASLMKAVLDRDAEGRLVRKAGVMAVVIADGEIAVGDEIALDSVPLVHEPLGPV